MDIQPIISTNPVTTVPVPEKVYDTWFLSDFRLSATGDRKFVAEIFWTLGRINADGTSELSGKTTNHFIPDLLSEESLLANPEITTLVPDFLSTLAAVSKRANVI
jgi:hypothetical protein